MRKQMLYQSLKQNIKKRKGNAIILFLFSAIAIFTVIGFAVDAGMILSARYELQKALETAALSTIADYEAYEVNATRNITYPSTTAITTLAAANIDAYLKSNSFLGLTTSSSAPIVTFGSDTSKESRALQIRLSSTIKTYFLYIIGIKSLELNATAAAMHVPLYIRSANILTGSGAYLDTDIREPLGAAQTVLAYSGSHFYVLPQTKNINAANSSDKFTNIYGPPDNYALSLGPGGYITFKLSAPIVDGKGFDLQIMEKGNVAEGYFVFAGNDTNPASPYIDAAHPGGGISWRNISCTGTPVNAPTNSTAIAGSRGIGSYVQNIGGAIGNQPKFYGSGFFDLGASCSGGYYSANLNSAKYLRIIDDNTEDGFEVQNPELSANMDALPEHTPGEHTSGTPGADIDSISIEHHPRLITPEDFVQDTDSDHLIDAFEILLGLNPNGGSDGISDDSLEFWGGTAAGPVNIIMNNSTNALRTGVPKDGTDTPYMIISYP